MSHMMLFNSVIDVLEKELNAERTCLEIAESVLKYASHVPLVTNIARGAGFCYYYARIAESIGARHMPEQRVSRIAGKGSTIHKLLGILSLRLFSQGITYVLSQAHNVQTMIEEMLQVDDFRQLLQILKSEINDTVLLASSLMLNLLSNLPRMLAIIGVDHSSKVFPIVEQQFIDYTLHMRGVPDLILEFPKEKAALVIEWKTTRETPSKHEEAQVICYALMEAVRLGYNTKEKAINAIIGELSRNGTYNTFRVNNVKVLPAIIRPVQRGQIKPHPLMFTGSNELEREYDSFKKLIYDVCLIAEHLTLLTTNIRAFSPIDRDFEGICTKMLTFNDREVQASIFRIKPSQIYCGFPKERNSFPCVTRNGEPFCYYNYEYGPCEFYFGRGFGEKTDFDRAMWSLRFKVFDEKEKMLLPYRCLHELFRIYPIKKVIEKIRNGEGFEWHFGEAPYPSTIAKMQMKVYRRGKLLGSFRLDVLDECYIEDDLIRGYRKLRPIEIDEGFYRVIPEGKPVLITIVDSWTPLLSIGTYGRIDEVEVREEKNGVEYIIGLPSSALRYSMAIFREYLNIYPEKRNDILIFEINVDLLGAELQSIDAMQRMIKKMLENEQDENVKQGLEKQLEEIRKVKEEIEPVEPFLSRIIGGGLRPR